MVRRILTKYFDACNSNNNNQIEEHLKIIREALTINEIVKENENKIIDNQTPISEQTKGKFVW